MQTKDDNYYMREAIKLASKAEKNGDVPVGALLVLDGKIIARGYNRIEKDGLPTRHAEIIVIEKSVRRLGYKHLLDSTLYVTLEPCSMCSGAIVLARIKRLVFGAYDPKTGASGSLYSITNDNRLNHRLEVSGGVMEQECAFLLKNFFKSLRGKLN